MHIKAGVDLGTSSIGFMVWGIENNIYEPLYHEVRIFKEPVNNDKYGLTLKSKQRRIARQARRQQKRYTRRMKGLKHLGQYFGLSDHDVHADRSIHLTEYRALAAIEKIGLKDFFHVLVRLAKRRGYSGGFKQADAEDVEEDAEDVEGGASALNEKMKLLAAELKVDKVTLGQYLYSEHRKGNSVYLKAQLEVKHSFDDVPRKALFALRDMVKDEFHAIWDEQSKHHYILNSIVNGKSLKDSVYHAIFYQRPLKAPRAMVSACIYEPTLLRAPCAHPAYQQFRIEKLLADLRWGGGRRASKLTIEQAQFLRDMLNGNNPAYQGNENGEYNINSVLKELKKAGLSDPLERTLNINGHGRGNISGNNTEARMRKFGLQDSWAALSNSHQTTVINLLSDLGDPALFVDNWHLTLKKDKARKGDDQFRKIPEEVVHFIELMKSTKNDKGKLIFDRLSKMGFNTGRCSYSIKALNKFNQWFTDAWHADIPKISEYDAQQACYSNINENNNASNGTITPAPKTGNAVVDVALRELHGVLTRFTDTTGLRIDEIVVETNRELGLGVNARNKINKKRNDNEKINNAIRSELSKYDKALTKSNIRRYKLWQQQDERWCPYCDREFSTKNDRTLSLEKALNGNETNYEHIIPKNLTQVNMKLSELVLAHSCCNAAKGNRTPYQAFGPESADPSRWNWILSRAAKFREKAKLTQNKAEAYSLNRKADLLTLQDFEADVLSDESIADFSDRQLHQTSWIAKTASMWLGGFIAKVYTTSGRFTALTRRQWRLETIIPEVRIENGMTVSVELINDGDKNSDKKKAKSLPITPEIFDTHKTFWEGQGNGIKTDMTLYKRNDHRHHLIDAIAISLMSRSLLIQIIKESQRNELKSNSRKNVLYAPCPMHIPSLRLMAKNMVEYPHISHKPDRHIEGAFFQDNPYSLDKKKIEAAIANGEEMTATFGLCQRVNLSDLARKTEAETRAVIQNTIVGGKIREVVLKAFDERIAEGKNHKEALQVSIYNPINNNRILKVKVSATPKGQPIKLDNSILISDGYAYIDVWQEAITVKNKVKYVVKHDPISCYEAHKRRQEDRKSKSNIDEATLNSSVSDTPRIGLKRFYIGDTVVDKKTNAVGVITTIKATGPLVLIQHIYDIDVPKVSVSGKRLYDLTVIKECQNTKY